MHVFNVMEAMFRLYYSAPCDQALQLRRCCRFVRVYASSTEILPRVVLKGGKAKLFSGEQSNPLVYGGAVDRVVGRPPPRHGQLVSVCDGSEREIGIGVFNPDSQYRVRMLLNSEEGVNLSEVTVDRIINERIQQAYELRKSLGIPCALTTVYRLINSEGDRLSGLIVDVLDSTLVVASSAAWIEKNKSVVIAALQRTLPGKKIEWRPSVDMLEQEGWELPEEDHSREENENREDIVTVLEHGIKYKASTVTGQKTGFYADQRDSRLVLQNLSAGKRVLDLCCYSGGFALNASAGGAIHVIGVDSSSVAIDLARENAALNGFEKDIEFVKNDIADYMKTAKASEDSATWDIIILDPPKFAPNRKSLLGALRKYRRLNALAMSLLVPGGLLMTCSCSGAVAATNGCFEGMLRGASSDAQRRVTVLRKAGAASDHPVDVCYPEGRYLTNVLLRVA